MRWQRATTAIVALTLLLAACSQASESRDDDRGDSTRASDPSGSVIGGDSGTQSSAVGDVSARDECLAPSEPPANPVDSEELVYDAHDAREVGAEPPPMGEFVAFHTRLPYADRAVDPRQESMHPISGELADVVVNLPDLGRLEFARRTSYRPVWVPLAGSTSVLPEVVAHVGDGDAHWPDRLNRYSYARVVEAGASEIVVHWRYVPDFCDPTPSGVVHELFSIQSDGAVARTVHIGADTLERSADVEHNLQQDLTLDASGLAAGALTGVAAGLTSPDTLPSALDAHPVTNPVIDVRLDDGIDSVARIALEAASGAEGVVGGRFPNWMPGVSGTALAFDGYTTEVALPASQTPVPGDSFSVEAWVSLAAYPFGTVQVAGQATTDGNDAFTPDPLLEIIDEGEELEEGDEEEGDEEDEGEGDEEGGETVGVYDSVDPISGMPQARPVTAGGLGYLLAVDALGKPQMLGNFGGSWTAVGGPATLSLHEWHHLAGVYDASAGRLALYVDGIEVAVQPVSGPLRSAATRDFVIGLNRDPVWNVGGSEMHTEAFTRSLFGIEGLIDEVRLYDRGLSAAEVRAAASRPGAANAPVLASRELPDLSGTGFAATQATLDYHPLWDQLFHDSGYDDVVVSFDSLPTSVVFWKGMTYGPAWVSGNGVWAHDQSMEFGDSQGLVEHMGDKQVRYAHARVVEATDARIVVHWRYAPVAVSYRLFETAGELGWVDEYYTIYPDGTTVRFVDDWFGSQEGGPPAGWQGTYVLTPPGADWSEIYNPVVASVMTADGKRGDLDVVEPTDSSAFLSGAAVIWTNTRSEYRLYRGVTGGSEVVYHEDLLAGDWAPFEPEVPEDYFFSVSPLGLGNHWPVAQAPNDGRGAFFNDRLSHSEGFAGIEVDAAQKSMLYGFSRSPEAALPMVNGWNDPPDVIASSLPSEGFERGEHAYHFSGAATTLSFTLSGSTTIHNPGIVVRGWTGSATPTVTVDGASVPALSGLHFNRGERTLVVWVPFDAATAELVIDGRSA